MCLHTALLIPYALESYMQQLKGFQLSLNLAHIICEIKHYLTITPVSPYCQEFCYEIVITYMLCQRQRTFNIPLLTLYFLIL